MAVPDTYTPGDGTVRWDTQGRPYVLRTRYLGNGRWSDQPEVSYLSPAEAMNASYLAQPGVRDWLERVEPGAVAAGRTPGGYRGTPPFAFRKQGGWNDETGRYDRDWNLGGIMNTAVGGFLGAGIGSALGGGAGAGGITPAGPGSVWPAGTGPTAAGFATEFGGSALPAVVGGLSGAGAGAAAGALGREPDFRSGVEEQMPPDESIASGTPGGVPPLVVQSLGGHMPPGGRQDGDGDDGGSPWVSWLRAAIPVATALAGRGGRGNWSGLSTDQSASLDELLDLAKRRALRTDPLHEMVTQLAQQRMPIPSRAGVTPYRAGG